MGKIKKFAAINIQKIVGGKDPIRVVEEFILRLKFDPDKVLKDKNGEMVRWMLQLEDDCELEILLENPKKPQETTVYLGVNVLSVPLRGASDILCAALEVADGLVGIKVSLVGYFLVLSATLSASDLSVEELQFNYQLITAQRGWFIDSLDRFINGESEGD